MVTEIHFGRLCPVYNLSDFPPLTFDTSQLLNTGQNVDLTGVLECSWKSFLEDYSISQCSVLSGLFPELKIFSQIALARLF